MLTPPPENIFLLEKDTNFVTYNDMGIEVSNS